MKRFAWVIRSLAATLAATAAAAPAWAAEPSPAPGGGAIAIKPLLDARLRLELAEQGERDATALTIRLRPGLEAKLGRFALVAEAEVTAAPVANYNAFPFALSDRQWRPQHAVVADPENAELNRLQLQYRSEGLTVTAGRQRINLDDQRWLGSVGWRQNEQTFDAVRAEVKAGTVAADLVYAVSQRTIFGREAEQRRALDGDFILAGIGPKVGAVQGKLFAYLLDYDEAIALANSSQTYGGILGTSVPLSPRTSLALRASYARQSDYAGNPNRYAADYWSLDGAVATSGFNLAAGLERLGTDDGHSLQTPMATLHKFNGWADLFLTTPPAGLRDWSVVVGKSFTGVKALSGLNASLAFHRFDSASGDLRYGREWNASVGADVGKVRLLLKFADYRARTFGADTRKAWLQAEWSW